MKLHTPTQRQRAAVVALLTVATCILTYHHHVILRLGTVIGHFCYIPIIFACIWWKRKGLAVAIFLALFLIVSHNVLRFDASTPNDYFRAVMFIVVACVVVALTERAVKSELAMRECEVKYKNLFEMSPDAVFLATFSKTPRVMDCNRNAPAMFGCEREDFFDDIVANFLPPLQPDGSSSEEKIQRMIQAALEGRPQSFECTCKRSDGTPFDTQVSVDRLNLKGQTYLQAVVRDITEQKRMEEETKRLEAQLARAHRMEAIGTLAGGIAHDFNNILGAILAYTEIALEGVCEKTALHEYLSEILHASGRAKDLINHILTFSRQSEQKRKPLQLDAIVQEAIRLLKASMPANIRIRQIIKAKVGTVMADASQIHQVLINCCANSSHAMRKKGGTLDIRLEDVYLDADAAAPHPHLKPGAAYVKLTVSDTGEGIHPKDMERIFDPFFSTKPVGQGTGMGLALVHGIVRSHGGAILVDSEPQVGTTFQIYLPGIEAVPIQEMHSLQPIPVGNERLLLIDDEPALVNALRLTLESLGYEVIARTSSIEALDAFRAQPDKFDLVITDQTMPNMTGAELAQELLRLWPDIPIILCTGFSEIMSSDQAKAIGIREFIMKPIEKRQLAESIRRVLDGSLKNEQGKGNRKKEGGAASEGHQVAALERSLNGGSEVERSLWQAF